MKVNLSKANIKLILYALDVLSLELDELEGYAKELDQISNLISKLLILKPYKE
jgi:hypothetical protein